MFERETKLFSAPDFETTNIDSPAQIIKESAVIIPMYLSDNLNNLKIARNFFQTSTLPFLEDAERGFSISSNIQNTLDTNDLKKLIEHNSRLLKGQDNYSGARWNTAYAISFAIFLAMKEIAPINIFPVESFELESIFTPPADAEQILDRIHELQFFIHGLGNGEITPKNFNRIKNTSLRSMAFFAVGKNILSQIEPNKNQVKHTIQIMDLIS